MSALCLEALLQCAHYLQVRSRSLAWQAAFFLIWPLLASLTLLCHLGPDGPLISKLWRSRRCIMLPKCYFLCLGCPLPLFSWRILVIFQMLCLETASKTLTDRSTHPFTPKISYLAVSLIMHPDLFAHLHGL
jgi:hypothetical protein